MRRSSPLLNSVFAMGVFCVALTPGFLFRFAVSPSSSKSPFKTLHPLVVDDTARLLKRRGATKSTILYLICAWATPLGVKWTLANAAGFEDRNARAGSTSTKPQPIMIPLLSDDVILGWYLFWRWRFSASRQNISCRRFRGCELSVGLPYDSIPELL